MKIKYFRYITNTILKNIIIYEQINHFIQSLFCFALEEMKYMLIFVQVNSFRLDISIIHHNLKHYCK